MKSVAKEKIRSSGPTRSYLQTRIRASRLRNAARLLALVELSRRLHQAYRQAYDKQAADWLLPQNPWDPRIDFRDYALQLSTNGQSNDCLKLALLAYKAGQVFADPIHGLLNGLTEISDAFGNSSDPNYRVGVLTRDTYYGNGFGGSGFLAKFSDPSNQVRHFVGWFAAGAYHPGPVARRLLYSQEGTRNQNDPDVELGVIEQAPEIFHEHLLVGRRLLLALASMTNGQADTTPSSIVLRADKRKAQMRINSSSTALSLFGIVALLAACTMGRSNHQTPALTKDSSSVSQPMATEQEAESKKTIRSVDFANFTFPWPLELGDPRKPFTLRSGELKPTRDNSGMVKEMGATLQSIAYGDVTADGVEEAMVVLSIVTGGSAIPHTTYIYALENGKPKLLWAFAAGDRADGGLRRIAAENGNLVVDLFGVGTAIGKELYGTEDVGACCPKHFTRTKYKWIGTQFRQDGPEEVFENSTGSSAPVTPATSSPR